MESPSEAAAQLELSKETVDQHRVWTCRRQEKADSAEQLAVQIVRSSFAGINCAPMVQVPH